LQLSFLVGNLQAGCLMVMYQLQWLSAMADNSKSAGWLFDDYVVDLVVL
jgi:hypothetical protein